MNKVTRTVITCGMVYVLSFGLTAAVMGEGGASREATTVLSEAAVRDTVEKERSYVVKEHNGVVAVFIKGEDTPAFETDIFVSSLRARDREQIQSGITKDNYTEVLCLLEDLDS